MKNLFLFFLLITSSSHLLGQNSGLINEDKQGEIFSTSSRSLIYEINNLLLKGYAYEHKSIVIKNDSLVQINKYGKRSIKISDIDVSSINVKDKKEDDGYRIFIKCRGGQKLMVADWGNYNTFGLVLKNKSNAHILADKIKRFVSSYR